VIPIYNGKAYIDRCLKSITQQSLRGIEIICVNDGSTDDSLAILKRWQASDSRIVVVDQKNGGPASARNAGLRKVTGKYTGFADIDDWVEPNTFKRAYKTANKHNADVLEFGYSVNIDKTGKPVRQYQPKKIGVFDNGYFHFSLHRCWWYIWNKIFKSENIKTSGILFRTDIKVADDSCFCIEMTPWAKKVVTIPDILYHYIINSNGNVAKYQKPTRASDQIKIFTAYFEVWKRKELRPYLNDAIEGFKTEIRVAAKEITDAKKANSPYVHELEKAHATGVDYLNKLIELSE
jgi:glycosyltransferase involved in cell wall biosynthesis